MMIMIKVIGYQCGTEVSTQKLKLLPNVSESIISKLLLRTYPRDSEYMKLHMGWNVGLPLLHCHTNMVTGTSYNATASVH